MPRKPATQQQLLAENEGLRVRLAQAEETLREMRSGGVDALVVSGVGGAQLFTLKHADQAFRLLVEEMGEGALTMTAEGVIVYANRSFAGLLKTPLEKVMGSAIRTWIAPDSQPILQSQLEKGAGEERRAELMLAASDGTRVPVHLSVSNLPINGSPDAYCLVAIDLTEHRRIEAIAASERVARELLAAANQSRGELLRVIEEKTRAEKALAQESRRNRMLLRSASDGVHIIDADGNVLEVSDSFCRMLGYSREELIGANASLWDAQWSQQALKHKIAEQLGKEGCSVFETRHRRRDGGVLDVEVSGQSLELDGKPVSFNSARDITERKRAEVEARTLSRAMEQSPASIIITDRAGIIEYVNPRFEQVTGYTRAEVVGMNPRVLKSGKNAPEVYEQLWAAISVGSEWRGELCNRRKNGEMFWEFAAISGVKSENGEVERYIAVKEDITERKEAENKIRRLNRVYAMLSGINALIVRVRDRDELFKEACRVAVNAGKFPLAWIGVVDRAAMKIKPVAWHGAGEGFVKSIRLGLDGAANEEIGFVARAVRERQAMVSDDITKDPRVLLRKEASDRGFRSLVLLPLLVEEEAVGVLALYAGEVGFFDEEEMKLLHELAGDIAFALDHIEKSEKIEYLALYDQLSGLANRTLLLERLNQQIRAAGQDGSSLALVLFDVVRLRTINESLGRQAGDALLKQVVDRLVLNVDRNDLGRLGADHFTVALRAVNGKSEAAHRLEKMWRDIFGEPFTVRDTELRLSPKSGITLYPNDGTDADTLVKNAEAAHRKSRETGEPMVFYTQGLTERTTERLTLENQLRQALEKEEFVLHYQPKVDLETRSIVGVEALIRWQSPELGLVPPMKFIPLMEQTGLILPVGSWALKRASLDHRSWVNQGLKAPRVAVNVSSIQLRQRDFVGAVEQAIIEGVAPTGVDLEITESLIMEDVQGSIEKLKTLRGLGLSIAIDDFGTGYSSLGYLAKLPVQSLKIDRSFIITMLNDPDTMTLVSTIISLAHSLRLKVVAEGVDAEEQAKMLRLLRCDEMQGYLFSRPVAFDQMTALLLQEAKG